MSLITLLVHVQGNKYTTMQGRSVNKFYRELLQLQNTWFRVNVIILINDQPLSGL